MNNAREQLRGRLAELMREKLELRLPQALEDTLRINEDLRIDSISLLQLIVHIEATLGLRVPEEEVDAKAFATVGSLLDFIGRLAPAAEEAARS
ncbi:phosphopantetheine-binding protein [Paenibacillus methanolicus]|uniref:Acyl carrier protein n=1 Tax=Paenibacillus methanolicus TaxID=582686 RepID=A0A5S5BUG9_9BACL|nr:phosphopantetheine-binding protein [Paenibacillus methanolicus]TYP70614.1 acyl carrier protein [Paenibacillus methanolicus]